MMESLEDEGVRDATKSWLGVTPWSDVYVLAIDKGEVNTVAAFASSPTSAAGYNGRAESTLFYSSTERLRSRNESVRQGHHFRNRIAEELCADIGEKAAASTTLNDTLDVLHALNSTNEWRRLRQEVERKAALSRAADQILDGVLGTHAANESKSVEELGARKLLVFVGNGGGGVRKGSRGPNPANRLVRELEIQAEARGIDAKFVVVPETMTSKRCSKPYCRDEDGRRSKVELMHYGDGESCFRVVQCERCRMIANRDAVGSANIMSQGVSLLFFDEVLWRTAGDEKKL